MKKYIIDRIEKEYAVCENCKTGKMENIIRNIIPESAKDGDVLLIKDDNTAEIDEEETRKRKERIEKLRNKLKKN